MDGMMEFRRATIPAKRGELRLKKRLPRRPSNIARFSRIRLRNDLAFEFIQSEPYHGSGVRQQFVEPAATESLSHRRHTIF